MSSGIELEHVSRNFGAVKVLHDVNLHVDSGEVRAMVGEHGAGKSTIANIMGGLITPTAGKVWVFGKQAQHSKGPFKTVEVVHQRIELMENLTVTENMFATDRKRLPWILGGQRRLHSFTNRLFAELGVRLKGEFVVGDLKRADWVVIDILRKLHRQPQLLILDEAIEQLSSEHARIVLDILRRERQRGMAVIYITHRIDDIYTFADSVSVVKSGTICLTQSAENIDKINLIKIAYTQLSVNNTLDQYNEEFFQLLKYNEAILRKLPVSLIVVNRDETVKIINEAAQELLNIDESYGNEQLERVFGDSQDIVGLIKRSFQKQEVQQFYYLPFRRSDGKEILINMSKVPIFDEHFLIGNILILQDITEQELLREEFELREKLAATGLLAAGVAHEINNPIGMILNDLHFLKVVSKDERIQNRVGNLEKHFGFITEVISNLLSFSHERESENKAVEINSAVQELVRLLNHYVERNDSRLAFSPQAGELHAAINANELKQVLLNLIKNSIEAFTGGGTIRIETRESVVDGEQCAQVDVIDDGPGISADNMNDVFLPFKSAKKASNSNSGLGLSVSYSIVKKYNGQISVDSDNGRGCRFSLRFPMVRVASA